MVCYHISYLDRILNVTGSYFCRAVTDFRELKERTMLDDFQWHGVLTEFRGHWSFHYNVKKRRHTEKL
jgi:hypothetical protein